MKLFNLLIETNHETDNVLISLTKIILFQVPNNTDNMSIKVVICGCFLIRHKAK